MSLHYTRDPRRKYLWSSARLFSKETCFKEFCNILRPQNEEEKKELKELYDMFDNNGDGEIDIDEFFK